MSKLRKVVSMAVLLAFLVGSLGLTGCTKYANEEELKLLDETKAAALAAEEKVKDLDAEKANLDRELQAKKAEHEKVKREKELVRERLSKME
jgi:outer membrane murein-binding lipoprotein Lpp